MFNSVAIAVNSSLPAAILSNRAVCSSTAAATSCAFAEFCSDSEETVSIKFRITSELLTSLSVISTIFLTSFETDPQTHKF